MSWTTDISDFLYRGWGDRAWVFKGSRCVEYRMESDTTGQGPDGIDRLWPGLGNTPFAEKIDAALHRGWGDRAWFFTGDQCAKYRMDSDRLDVGPIAIASQWPGLRDTPFAQGIDAALYRGWGDRAWFFKADQCVEYRMDDDTVSRTGAIAKYWSGLAGL
ncbi:hypothetical protein ACGF13_35925 [Kitasatospora sp. NPDC048286]|uniref:hypothetical protein n=1 Tax=Kitasatospora sp. NPDC048286 TaxID=3364047 RepID=UPI00371AE68F